MLDIIICEDDVHQREEIEMIVKESLQSLKINSTIALSVSQPELIINQLRSTKNVSFIYFLDIGLGCDMNGIELAKEIRKYDAKGYIVFITSHAELTLLTFEFKVQALDYIIKTDFSTMKSKITECIAEANKNYNKACLTEKSIYTIDTSDSIIRLKHDDILFFETTEKKHKIRIHTFEKQIEFYGSLKEIQNELPSNYYKSHRAFIVNTDNIKSIDKKKLVINMKNGEICYISLRYLKGLIEKCLT